MRVFLVWIVIGFSISILFDSCSGKVNQQLLGVESPTTNEATSVVAAQINSNLPINENLVSGELSNGLKYYLLENSKPVNRAELRLVVNAGSMQEDDNQRGVAHFVEHMAFNGSKNFQKNQLIDYLQSVGTRFGPDLNAYTSFDETVYKLQVRTDVDSLFRKGILVLEDWAAGISFDSIEVEKERGIVLSEWRSGLSANQRMQKEYFPLMYSDSRYASRMPIGETKVIKEVAMGNIRSFYDDWYRPELMAIVIVGDVDVVKTVKYLEGRFGMILPKAPRRTKQSNVIPFHEGTLVSIVSDSEAPFTQVQMFKKVEHKSISNVKEYKEALIRNLYNAMLTARIVERTNVAEPDLVYGYSIYRKDLGDIAAFRSFAQTSDDKILDGFKTVLEENERVLRFGFTEAELDRQKDKLLERFSREEKEAKNTNSARYASQLVYHYLDQNPFMSQAQVLELVHEFLPEINLADFDGLSRSWMTDSSRVIVITAPKRDDLILPTEKEVIDLLDNVKNMHLEAYQEESMDQTLFDKVAISGHVISEMEFEDTGIKELKLSNGIRILLKHTDFKEDEIIMEATSPGGHGGYRGNEYLCATYAANLVRESGVGPFDQSSIKKYLSGKNINVNPYIATYSEGISASCSPLDLETMLQMTHLYIAEPRIDEIAFKAFVSKQKSIFQNIASSPSYYFMNYTGGFRSNFNERTGFPTPEEIDKVRLEKAIEIYNERFADVSDFTFTFVGNFKEENLKPLLNKYLGSLPNLSRTDTLQMVDLRFRGGKLVDRISKGKADKSQVELFYHDSLVYSPELQYHLNSVLAVLRNRLRQSLREDRSGVYGVQVSGSIDRIPSAKYRITIAFNCDPGRESELISAVRDEIKSMQLGGASPQDLQKVKEMQLQSMIKLVKENRFWSYSLNQYAIHGGAVVKIGLPAFQGLSDNLGSSQIKSAAIKFFGKNEIVLIMEPEKAEK